MRRRVNSFIAGWVTSRWEDWQFTASITNSTARGKKFKQFGDGSLIAFPWVTIYNEHYIEIGADTMLGPYCALSAGMMPGQECVTSPVVRIGDRCLIGRGSGIVGHLAIEIGNDVWTGHHVYITDQNHGYQDVTRPISQQTQHYCDDGKTPGLACAKKDSGTKVLVAPTNKRAAQARASKRSATDATTT